VSEQSRADVTHTLTINRLGFWSAALAFLFSVTFTIGALAGLPKPWDVYIPIGASLLLALVFVTLTVAIHYSVPNDGKIWSHLGIVFAVLYASLVSLVYVTWLFVVEPHILKGDSDKVALLIFEPGSFLQMVDGLGYTLMMIAALCSALAFVNRGLGRWIRWVGIANGILAIPEFLSYVYYSLILGVGWVITFPLFCILVAAHFRQPEGP
jgi:hypothetical protein